MGKAEPVHPDGLERGSLQRAFRTTTSFRRQIRRSVPIKWRWARCALCILPTRRGLGIAVE